LAVTSAQSDVLSVHQDKSSSALTFALFKL
jgi:hypothetical protein